jgi:hypothetical protein
MRALLLIPILLPGCNKGGVNPFDSGETEIEDAQDVREACEERADELITQTYRVEFEAIAGGCAWGEDGNIGQEQGVLTARVEQVEALDLGPVVICDMGFDFSGEGGMVQRIVYDDNFLFVFNGVVLAGSYRPWVDALPAEDIFRIYDWDTIVGMENLFEDVGTYCVGEDTDQAECDIPPPETQGPIELSFDLGITSELSYRAHDQGRVEFMFVATGDNDASVDCAHEAFSFEVEVPYLPTF